MFLYVYICGARGQGLAHMGVVQAVLSCGVEGSSSGNLCTVTERKVFFVVLPLICLCQSRAETFRELQMIYQTKVIPFSSWYAEQQRIQKGGGTIIKVELASGTAERNLGNV
uniref:CpcD-like domain-containing protein n=1 Tax=Rhodosorus marinus TaxID=101924 RepID=A0A7S3EKQ7_9RHOD|mmetsp:Transcript_44165/g.172189  ORF Transcript_44165/g.172189 Transcript_44165/m.172189 type:complete len:112 (+) Transcript_44165:455-790(+)